MQLHTWSKETYLVPAQKTLLPELIPQVGMEERRIQEEHSQHLCSCERVLNDGLGESAPHVCVVLDAADQLYLQAIWPKEELPQRLEERFQYEVRGALCMLAIQRKEMLNSPDDCLMFFFSGRTESVFPYLFDEQFGSQFFVFALEEGAVDFPGGHAGNSHKDSPSEINALYIYVLFQEFHAPFQQALNSAAPADIRHNGMFRIQKPGFPQAAGYFFIRFLQMPRE